MWNVLRVVFLLIISSVHGLEPSIEGSAFTPNDTRGHSNQRTEGPHFQGLILLPSRNDLNPQGYEGVNGVMTYDLKLPGSLVTLKKEVRKFYNEPLNKEMLLELKTRVIEFYQKHDNPVVAVSIPEQDISSGVVQMVVTQGVLGKVTVTGNKWFSKEEIEQSVRLEEGHVIAGNLLNQDLYWLNRNPFRHIDAIYTPGEEEGTTDIELQVKDRFPLRIYAGIDNTGNDVTGNNRLFTGFNWGKLFGTDQSLSYQYATSSDFKRIHTHSLFYEAPLPWRHLLLIYGGYSSVDADFCVPNLKGSKFHTSGFSLQGSLRYGIPLKTSPNFLHEITAGADFKRTNNNLDFGGRPVISQDNVNLTQVMLSYNLGYEAERANISFEIEGFWSPGKWISDQTNRDYESLRPFAKNQYVYARSAFTLIWRMFKEWSMHQYLRGQWASINLLPSEEYALGGYNTVRGYKERVINGDNAFIWNFEMRTPPVTVLPRMMAWKHVNDQFQALIFFDYGLASVKRTAPGQKKSEYLVSLGPGVRYSIGPFLTLRADWGFQLHHITFNEPDHRLHFALTIGY